MDSIDPVDTEAFFRQIEQFHATLEEWDKTESTGQMDYRQNLNLQSAGEDWMGGRRIQPSAQKSLSYSPFDLVSNNISSQFQPSFSTTGQTSNIITNPVQSQFPTVSRTSNNDVAQFQYPRASNGSTSTYTSSRSQLTFPTSGLTSNSISSRSQLTLPSTGSGSNSNFPGSQLTFPTTGTTSNNVFSQWQPSYTTSPAPDRLSLAPRNTYNEVAASPRTINNANNYFRQDPGRHQGTHSDHSNPRSIFSHSDASGMFPIRSPVMQQYTGREQPPDLRKAIDFSEETSRSTAGQLRPQRSKAISNGPLCVFKPPIRGPPQSSSPMAGIASSPTARVSLRRASHTTMPRQHLGERHEQATYSMPEIPEVAEVPRTPQRHNMQQPQHTPRTLNLPHAPPMIQGIQLISPQQSFADQFRPVFPYNTFNAVQSKCFPQIYTTNDNIVVSAPTGSGKTVLLEMAICKVIQCYQPGQFKIVYQAPTKSLCSERLRDWEKKFSYLNLAVAELTGDTSQSEMARVRNASIIVTTPEKWDSITRKWTDHVKLVKMVKLFLIDEVHMLKDIRGATLEAVVSRMKTMGADIRFVAISATVPNSHDIATWLGKDNSNQHLPAHREEFGELFRPVQLVKHVRGYDGSVNDFVFDKILDGKVPTVVQQFSEKKPIMVFCFTRTSCETTARILAEHWTRQDTTDRAWPTPTKKMTVLNEDLRTLVNCGVAFHHAGLEPQDRQKIETAFLRSEISVICCTSTLAVGVNLPCHLVILKGTVGYHDGGKLTEYSDLDVMQMLGRAGRPQFDSSAVAVIMTRSETANRYNKLISGQQTLESTLHGYLIEHLNSEISLGTIKSLSQAQRWIHGTFLAVRMKQNPDYYKMDGVPNGLDINRALELVCERDIKLLQDHGLVDRGENFGATEYGHAMSRSMVPFETSKKILALPKTAKINQILQAISQAAEFNDLRIKQNERPFLRHFNDSPLLKYPLKETINERWHKIYLMIQVQLGGLDLPSDANFKKIRWQFITETKIILERAQRLARFVIDCKAADKDAVSVSNGLDLLRSLSALYWENSNLQLRQIPKIGPAGHKKLVAADVNSVEKLLRCDPAGIERILSRQPPYGHTLQTILQNFPRLNVKAEMVGQADIKKGKQPIVTVMARLRLENKKAPLWLERKSSVTFMAESAGKVVYMWRGGIVRLDKKVELKFSVELQGPADSIKCKLACDEIVGTLKTAFVIPNVSASAFPPRAPQLEEARATLPNATDKRDEFDDDGLADDEMVSAARNVETGNNRGSNMQKAGTVSRPIDLESNDFADIDDFEREPTARAINGNERKKKSNARKDQGNLEAILPIQSTRLSDGRWACNHTCRAGLKNGKLCKHKCCFEGLDKKPRRKAFRLELGSDSRPSAQPKSKELEGSAGFRLSSPTDPIVLPDIPETELVDLSELLPQTTKNPYPGFLQTKEPVTHSRDMPQFPHSDGNSRLPLFKDNQYMLSPSETTNSTASDRLRNFELTPSLYYAMNTLDDSVLGSVSPADEVVTPPHHPGFENGMLERESSSVPEAPQPGSDLDATTDPFEISAGQNLFDQEFVEPDFNELIDQNYYNEIYGQPLEQFQLPNEQMAHLGIPSLLAAHTPPKRPLSPNRIDSVSKYPRLSSSEPATGPAQLPSWTIGIDSDLIEELLPHVEFENDSE